MIRHATKLTVPMLLLTILSHAFCCGLPFVMTIATIASAGVVSGSMLPIEWIEAYHANEYVILAFATAVMLLNAVVHFVSKRVDCHDTGCSHPPCDDVKKREIPMFHISLALYIVSLVLFVLHSH